MTGQGSSPHPASLLKRRLRHACPLTRHPPRPRPAASPLTERSAARRRRRASRAATLALALTRSAQAERSSLAQTEQRPRQRSLLRPPDARAAAAAAVAASSPSLPPCGVWCARSTRQRPHPSRARPRRRRPRRRPRPRRRGCGDSWRQSESGRLSSVEPSGGGNDGSESPRRTWPKNHDRTTTTRTRLTRRTWPGLRPTPPLRGGARSKERN